MNHIIMWLILTWEIGYAPPRGHPWATGSTCKTKKLFFYCILCLPVSALRFLCTLTGSKHLGQAESYRCCTIGSIFCDWHMNSVKKMLGDLPFFNMFFFNHMVHFGILFGRPTKLKTWNNYQSI